MTYSDPPSINHRETWATGNPCIHAGLRVPVMKSKIRETGRPALILVNAK